VLAIHSNELAANALQLWETHGRSGELNGLFHVLDLDLASSFPFVVFLVCHDLGENVGCRFVEFVEIVLLRCRFLSISAMRQE
jgi:hypothetical protein